MKAIRAHWPFLVFAACMGLFWSTAAHVYSPEVATLWTGVGIALAATYWFLGEPTSLPDRVRDTTDIAEVCEHFAPRCTVHTDTGTYLARVTVLVGWRMRIPFYARTIQRRIYCELRKRGPFDAVFQVEVRR